jgi:hypothetical protein
MDACDNTCGKKIGFERHSGLTVFFERQKRWDIGVHTRMVIPCLPIVQQIVKHADRQGIETGKHIVEGPDLDG